MTITVNHILVPARDREVSARFLADLFGLDVTGRSAGSPPGRFAVVQVDGVSLDFETSSRFEPLHIAFLVDDAIFDRILSRLKEAGIVYSADPGHRRKGEINANEGGRGLYFHDPDGNNFELLTRA